MFGAFTHILVGGLIHNTHTFSWIYYYSRVRYTGPPGFSAEEAEATGITEAVQAEAGHPRGDEGLQHCLHVNTAQGNRLWPMG